MAYLCVINLEKNCQHFLYHCGINCQIKDAVLQRIYFQNKYGMIYFVQYSVYSNSFFCNIIKV